IRSLTGQSISDCDVVRILRMSHSIGYAKISPALSNCDTGSVTGSLPTSKSSRMLSPQHPWKIAQQTCGNRCSLLLILPAVSGLRLFVKLLSTLMRKQTKLMLSNLRDWNCCRISEMSCKWSKAILWNLSNSSRFFGPRMNHAGLKKIRKLGVLQTCSVNTKSGQNGTLPERDEGT